jgi:tetratricopeptide (TPR) repeat protein
VRARSALAANLGLVLASLVVTGLLFAGLEGLLRLTGIGAAVETRASKLAYQHLSLPILEPGRRRDGTAILRTVDPRLPYQSILAVKPGNGLRVFVLGESAVAGLGFSPNVTFARELERLLRTAYPDRAVEVVNLGIVALAARQVRLILEDVCRNYAPDAVLVYTGNNEFLEIHAEKYAEAHGTFASRAASLVARTHLYRVVSGLVGSGRKTAVLTESADARRERRLTEATLIRDIETGPEDVARIEVRYGETIDEMATVARRTSTPLVLMTVASNWKWRGREDLPDDWMDEFVPRDGSPPEDRLRRVREVLDDRLARSSPEQRSELLYRRATAAEAAADFEAARADFRAAMNADPHLRRALDALADRVRDVARRRGLPCVDVIEGLSRHARHGIIGFEEFYDYVHFTPRGAVLVAGMAFRGLLEAGVIPEPDSFDLGAALAGRLERLAGIQEDPLALDEWLGFGFDPSQIADRDLWKYDRLLEELDRRIELDPVDVRALVYRANAQAFRVDGAAKALADYERALAVSGGDPVIRSNRDRLLAERPS